jgi:cytochrome c oxidase assembly protein subunit 19
MASTSVHGRSRVSQTAPDKGSFPLDHFHECEEHAVRYNACLDKHQLMPKRCQKFQIQYLECRMKHNLMGKEKIENLGYTEVNTYENEEQVSPRLLSPYIDNLA